MLKLSDINIRDPFVLPVPSENMYYLYGTMGQFTWTDSAVGFDTYTSSDLENWAGPIPAFRPSDDFWADRNFWAPEVHHYRDQLFMFASFKAEGVRRGTQILMADTPNGPFKPHSNGPVTPRDWECLDGTFYLDPENQPWMIFCHEWVQVTDGEICALRLSDDLQTAVGKPQLLFRASEAPWTQSYDPKGRNGIVTDGPWMHRLPDGTLIMLWSSFGSGGYTIGRARSDTGDILGPWSQDPDPLYSGDGGHCMVFRSFDDGQLWLSFHRPNQHLLERPQFVRLTETDSTLTL